jgi:O-antigen/teichoic acid export membrane protein
MNLRKIPDLFYKYLPRQLIYIFFDVINKGINFLTLPLFLYIMSPDEFGEFSLYTSYISMFSIFIGLSVTRSIVVYYYDKNVEEKSFLTPILINIYSAFLFFPIILVITKITDTVKLDIEAIVVLILASLSTNIVSIGLEYLRAKNMSVEYGLFNLARVVLTSCFGLIIVYSMKGDLGYYRLLSLSIITIIFSLFVLISLMKKERINFSVNTATYMIKFSLPLIPYAIASTLLLFFDRLFIQHYYSTYEVGIYSFAYNIGVIMFTVALGLNKYLQPIIYNNYDNTKFVKKKINQTIYIFFSIYIVFNLLVNVFINILGNEDYYDAKGVVPIIFAAYAFYFLFSISENFFYFNKKNSSIMILGIAATIINVGLNILVIPPYGYTGAAITTAISYLALFLGSAIYSKFQLGVSILKITQIIIIFIIILVGAFIGYYI